MKINILIFLTLCVAAIAGLILYLVWLILKRLNQTSPEQNKTTVVFSSVELPENKTKINGELKNMELREGKKARITVSLLTAGGNPAAYQTGTEVFESSNPEIVSVTADAENPLQAEIECLDGSQNEAVMITFRADGDPDADETREIVGTLDVIATQGEAVAVEITAEVLPDDETGGDNE